MEIVIACGSMPFGPATPILRSLGGSETAALMLGKELAKRGHEVTMFCNLPAPDAPDAFQNGAKDNDGVRYIDLANYENYVTATEFDLLIAVRDPAFVIPPVQARKKVLWMHDIATKRGMQRAFDQMQWQIDEVWTVSEWHKRQVAETTGYPLANIVALRNGIVRYEQIDPTIAPPRSPKALLYAARPERGLDNLIRPGGIMDQLPEFKLVVAMYEHFPEHMRGYYEQIFTRMKGMPNVEFVGGKPNLELRLMMHEFSGYIYPTHFEETSCIIARECCETGLPMFTTKAGALPETLGDCGIYFEDWLAREEIAEPKPNTQEWTDLFVKFFREKHDCNLTRAETSRRMAARTDLYWDGVAELAEKHAEPKPVQPFSMAWSMLQDGDVIPAKAFLDDYYANLSPQDDPPVIVQWLRNQIEECYPFLYGRKTLSQHYEDIYTGKIGRSDNELHYQEDFNGGARYIKIAEQLAKLPAGSRVLEVGCGAGHILATLAKHLPQHSYVGVEFSDAAVACVNNGASERDRKNIVAYVADGTLPLASQFGNDFDAVIISEVLEHVERPWEVLENTEACVKKGGRVLITVPFGPWEPATFEAEGRWLERAHIWLVDKKMLNEMVGPNKGNLVLSGIVCGLLSEHRPYGNIFLAYDADHTPINAIDPLAKARRSRARQTCTAVVIAMNNEDTILRMLNSLDHQVQAVQIALGPCTDKTLEVIARWKDSHPYIFVNVVHVPKIEPYKFGFDDARNASIQFVETWTDWMLWLDTDEYVSGDFRKRLRHNSLDGYMISQHHFTTTPRGAPAQIDRPARLIRSDRKYKAYGHIHEHFEVPEFGPGRCTLLEDVDIGHTGYVNEGVRQERFKRNYPFLEWDHKQIAAGEVPERKLHHFLWFRDIVHIMRYAVQSNQPEAAKQKAQEAVDYYNTYWKEMATFGPGLYMSLAYLSEAYAFLGRGVEVRLQLALDDRSATIAGRFENLDQLQRIIDQMLKPEFEDRNSRYY